MVSAGPEAVWLAFPGVNERYWNCSWLAGIPFREKFGVELVLIEESPTQFAATLAYQVSRLLRAKLKRTGRHEIEVNLWRLYEASQAELQRVQADLVQRIRQLQRATNC